jgi:type I restriction enzyme S subunit
MSESPFPNHWDTVTAEEVCDYIQRGKQPEYSEQGDVNIINQRCIYWDELILSNMKSLSEEQRPKWQEYRYLQAGDVLLNSTGVGTVGRAQVFPGHEEPVVVDGHVTVMRPSDKLDSKFLYYFIRSDLGQRQIIPEGATGQVELRKKDILDIELPLPSIEEQQAIVRKLDVIFDRIWETSEAQKEAEEIGEQLLESCASSLIPQGTLPEGWTRERLDSLGEIMTGGTPRRSNEEYWGGYIPWVSPKDMGESYISDSQDKMTDLALEESSSAKLVPGDSLILVNRSSILEHSLPVAVTQRELGINQDMKAIIPDKDKVHVEYLLRCLQAFEQAILRKCSKEGTTVASLDSDQLYSFKIPIPSHSEQKDLVHKLATVEERIEEIRGSIDHRNKIVEELPKSILSKALHGELVDFSGIEQNKEVPTGQASINEF